MQRFSEWKDRLWRIKIHFLILGLFAVYLLSANLIYITFFLKNGKPIKYPSPLPPDTQEIVAKVVSLENILYDGEDQYELRGYVFSSTDPDSPQFDKILVLHSTSKNMLYRADQVFWRDLTKNFPQYNFNVDNGGFRAIISKNTLNLDNYQIGFLLVSKDGSTSVLHMVNSFIQREPNRLRLIIGQ